MDCWSLRVYEITGGEFHALLSRTRWTSAESLQPNIVACDKNKCVLPPAGGVLQCIVTCGEHLDSGTGVLLQSNDVYATSQKFGHTCFFFTFKTFYSVGMQKTLDIWLRCVDLCAREKKKVKYVNVLCYICVIWTVSILNHIKPTIGLSYCTLSCSIYISYLFFHSYDAVFDSVQ